MILEVNPDVSWDTEKRIFEQSEIMQELALAAISKRQPTNEDTVNCRGNYVRPTVRLYGIEDFTLTETFIYNNSPMSREFMGLTDVIYTLEPTNNGA
jgi:hypothetical protein